LSYGPVDLSKANATRPHTMPGSEPQSCERR
jgi:hypothetical protein